MLRRPVGQFGARKQLHDDLALARTGDLEGGHIIRALSEERRIKRQAKLDLLLTARAKRKFGRDNLERRTETPAEGAGGEFRRAAHHGCPSAVGVFHHQIR